MVKDLQLPSPYSPSQTHNPASVKHFAFLSALALNQSFDESQLHDDTLPNYDSFYERSESAIENFINQVQSAFPNGGGISLKERKRVLEGSGESSIEEVKFSFFHSIF